MYYGRNGREERENSNRQGLNKFGESRHFFAGVRVIRRSLVVVTEREGQSFPGSQRARIVTLEVVIRLVCCSYASVSHATRDGFPRDAHIN